MATTRLVQRKIQCSKCNSLKVARVIYGMPDFSDRLEKLEDQGKVVFGGCSISGNDPKYECTDCGTGYFKRPTGKDPNWTGKIKVTYIASPDHHTTRSLITLWYNSNTKHA